MTERKELLDSPKVLYLSGLPGSGKSTIAETIARNYSVKLVPEFLDHIPEWVIETRKDHSLNRRLAAQTWTFQQQLKKDNQLHQLSGPVIVDRCFLDVAIYAAMYGPEVYEQVLGSIRTNQWTTGTHLIIICNPDVAQSRLRSRGVSVDGVAWNKDWKPFLEDIYELSVKFATQLKIPVIDTSLLNVSQAVNRVIKQYNLNYCV